MSGVNPQGVRVSSFKVPSATELDHDYLWRYDAHLPARGDIGIFNRSHYEEVLVVRVPGVRVSSFKVPSSTELDHDYLWRYAARAAGAGGDRHLQPVALRGGPRRPGPSRGPRPPAAAARRTSDIWDRRYREINDWERYLVDNGIAVVKLFLNLSKEEQRIRFLKRIDVPERNWKFSAADVRERRRWDDYQAAFSRMLSATSTEHAPWYVVPADRKWFARICAGAVLAHALIDDRPPVPGGRARRPCATSPGVKRELVAEAPEGAAPDPYAAEHDGHGTTGRARARPRRASARDPDGSPMAMPARSEPTVQTEHAPQAPARDGDWYARSPADVAQALGVDPDVGLSAATAADGCARTARTRSPRSSRARAGSASSRSTAATCRSSWWPPPWSPC